MSTKNNDWKFGGISLKEIDATLENHFLVLKKIQQCLKETGLILVNTKTSKDVLRQNVETANADQEGLKSIQ